VGRVREATGIGLLLTTGTGKMALLEWKTSHPLPEIISGVPRNFVRGGGVCSTNSVEDRGQRERGSGGGSPLVRGSGGSCNLVQEISFYIVNFS
jgi:hypothetical protein